MKPLVAAVAVLVALAATSCSEIVQDVPESGDSPEADRPPFSPTQIAQMEARAERGDPEAQVFVGRALLTGVGVPADPVEGVRWLQTAASPTNGEPYAPALYLLGFAYEFGMGVPQNYEEMSLLYQQAADQGYPPGLYNFGRALSDDVFRDSTSERRYEAYRLFSVAAARSTGQLRSNAVRSRDSVQQDCERARQYVGFYQDCGPNWTSLSQMQRDAIELDRTLPRWEGPDFYDFPKTHKLPDSLGQ